MPRPFKHQSGVYYMRRRVPADLVKLVGKTEVKVSLRTKEPAEAKERHYDEIVKLDECWANLRKGQQALTEVQIQALAGEIYRAKVAEHSDDPGSSDTWRRLAEADRRLRDIQQRLGRKPSALRLATGWSEAETLSGFMREMGFAVTGGERGTIRQFKEQLNRLAACSMQIGLWDGRDSATTLNVPPFRSLELWRPRAGEGADEAGRTVRFDPEFYETLIRHALPVDVRAARAFSGSARKLDLLFWTGYRLRSLQRPLRLTWANLHAQFGAENASIRSFRQAFKADLAHLREVFPRLPLVLDEGGLTLHPADPSTLLVPPRPAAKGMRKRARE